MNMIQVDLQTGIVAMGVYLIVNVVCFWIIFGQAYVPKWNSFIPILNMYRLYTIGSRGTHFWWGLLLSIAASGAAWNGNAELAMLGIAGYYILLSIALLGTFMRVRVMGKLAAIVLFFLLVIVEGGQYFMTF